MSPASYRAAPPRVGETTIPQLPARLSRGGDRAAVMAARSPGSAGRGRARLPDRGLVGPDLGLQVGLCPPAPLEIPVLLRRGQGLAGPVDLAPPLVPRRVVRAAVAGWRLRGR